MDKLDIVKLWVRHYYKPDEDAEPRVKQLNVLGVPWHELGTAEMERVNQPYRTVDEKILEELIALEDDDEMGDLLRKSINPFYTIKPTQRTVTKKLLRVDDLVMRESVRREMGLWEHWVRMMVWGWFDPVGRRIPLWTEEELYKMMKGLPLKARAPPPDKGTDDDDDAKKDAEDKRADDGGEEQDSDDDEGLDKQK